MAVIIRKKVMFDDGETELPMYEPSGRISKEERLRADRLDEVLKKQVSLIATDVLTKTPFKDQIVERWYLLGKKLRAILEDRELVSARDIDSGVIWPAIWQYLPQSLKPKGIVGVDEYIDYRRRRKDYLCLGYELSEFEWDDINWIIRLEDWYQLASRPGIIRDGRILRYLGKIVKSLSHYPLHTHIREIAKTLGDKFPTRRYRDSSLLNDNHIRKVIKEAVYNTVSKD